MPHPRLDSPRATAGESGHCSKDPLWPLGPDTAREINRNATKKKHWIDFNAGVLLDGADMTELSESLFALCRRVADGEAPKSEENGYYDIAIFKDGVTL